MESGARGVSGANAQSPAHVAVTVVDAHVWDKLMGESFAVAIIMKHKNAATRLVLVCVSITTSRFDQSHFSRVARSRVFFILRYQYTAANSTIMAYL